MAGIDEKTQRLVELHVAAALAEAADVLRRHDSAPCSPAYPEAWTEERMEAYEAGQMDAAASWIPSILALNTTALTALDRAEREARVEGMREAGKLFTSCGLMGSHENDPMRTMFNDMIEKEGKP